MKEKIISFETAKLAKEKGFNIPTRNFYADISWNNKEVYTCSEIGHPEYTIDMGENHGFGDIILIPTQNILQKWLREIHNIDITIPPSKLGYFATISYWDKDGNSKEIEANNYYFKYEIALEEAFKKSLKILPNKN